jgi:hypothetical protein
MGHVVSFVGLNLMTCMGVRIQSTTVQDQDNLERQQWARAHLDASVLVTRLPLNSGVYYPSEHIWGVFSVFSSPSGAGPTFGYVFSYHNVENSTKQQRNYE